MYQAILTLGEYDNDFIIDAGIEALKEMVKEFFDETSCFIVIDDIDTLTTEGKEPGVDFLYRVISRAKKPSKILYTMRNRPTQSISSSIEIEGLRSFEYEEFLQKCGNEISVPVPKSQDVKDKLHQISEGRPLVIESVMRLKRNCGTYEDAFRLFENSSGENIRDYVFEREWNAIDSAVKGRELLAILALYDRPVGFSDLVSMSRLDEQNVRDALGAVQEMFLEVDNSTEETLWSMGQLTKAYVKSKAQSLDLYNTIKQRVENFKSTFYTDSPEINTIKRSADKAILQRKDGSFEELEALMIHLASLSGKPKIMEDPRFLAIRGYLNLWRNPVRLDAARMDFEQAFSFRFAPDFEYVKEWFDAEKTGDMANVQTEKILNLVLKSKGYDSISKAWFRSLRASFLFGLAREVGDQSPNETLAWLREALHLHLQVFRMKARNRQIRINKNIEYTVNTGFHIVNITKYSEEKYLLISAIDKMIKEQTEIYLDPLVQPISYCFEVASRYTINTRSERDKALGYINKIASDWMKSELWFDDDQKQFLKSLLETRKKIIKMKNV